ncbi:MAG: hypothetical protein OSA51_11660 [Octadecabacter sp.]|nr:hypothetical protein [Octadecabacter sp.]
MSKRTLITSWRMATKSAKQILAQSAANVRNPPYMSICAQSSICHNRPKLSVVASGPLPTLVQSAANGSRGPIVHDASVWINVGFRLTPHYT